MAAFVLLLVAALGAVGHIQFVMRLPAPGFADDGYTRPNALQLIRPVAIGTAPTGLDADNRIYRAYQGIPYEIQATARGGEWPYTYTLSGAPTGMSIEAGPCTTIGPSCTAGRITWTDPQATDSSITVRVTDGAGDFVEGTWGVTVSTTIGADGFCFVDGDAAGGGTGTLASPYNSLAAAFAGANCGARTIMYLRESASPYVVSGMTEVAADDCGLRVFWNEAFRPVIWLAYPGESPIIDFESTGSNTRRCIQMRGHNIWIDGLTLDNVASIGFQFNIRDGQFGVVVRKVTGLDLNDGEDGLNSAFFMWSSATGSESYFDTVQHSTFGDLAGDGGVDDDGQGSAQDGACALKIYDTQNAVYETSHYLTSAFPEGMIALKDGAFSVTVRANTSASDVQTFIGGNMNSGTGGEILHNLCRGSGTGAEDGCLTLGVSKIDALTEFHVYRNTFVGQVNLSNMAAADGPYNFTNNVIVNEQAASGSCPAQFDCYSVTDYTRLVEITNLKGVAADGIVDANGALTGASRTTYLGLRGYEVQ